MALNTTINYEDVLRDLETKKAQLDAAICTIRTLSGRENYTNPFDTVIQRSTQPTTEETVTTFAFGHNKGVPTDKMAVEDLHYYKNFITNKLATGKSRYERSDRKKLAIVEAELAKRKV